MRGRCGGFTLVELIVALAISGTVVLMAYRTLIGVADGAAALARTRAEFDRSMNARRWLIEAFGSLEVGTGSGGFAGRPNRVEFTTGQRVPEGWFETDHVLLTRVGDSLAAQLEGIVLTLARDVRSFDCDYLLDPGGATPWVREWISPVSAPLAVRLRIGYQGHADTLLLLVGPRG